MNFSRQALLGIGMILGGSVMLYAMAQQIGEGNQSQPTSAMIDKPNPEQTSPQPLTTDIATEKRLLAQKQQERAARVAEQQKRAQEFLTEQEVAEAEALAKARAESQQYVENITSVSDESDSADAESETTASEKTKVAAPVASQETKSSKDSPETNGKQEKVEAKAETQEAAEQKKAAAKPAPTSSFEYQVKKGDGLLKIAQQNNVSVEALAQANGISPSSTALKMGQKITIPSGEQLQRLEREGAAAEKVRKEQRKKEEALAKKSVDAKRDAQQKLSAARKEVKETDAKGSFGVQVALANSQAQADELVKKLESAGYKAKTSRTSRGVRVVVGPERGKIAALALKNQINSDPQLKTTSAWVLYW